MICLHTPIKKDKKNKLQSKKLKKILLKGELIEMYSNYPRGKSCLVAGKEAGDSRHVVCGMRGNRLIIVTVPTKETNLDQL
jgi:hypothetical protein